MVGIGSGVCICMCVSMCICPFAKSNFCKELLFWKHRAREKKHNMLWKRDLRRTRDTRKASTAPTAHCLPRRITSGRAEFADGVR